MNWGAVSRPQRVWDLRAAANFIGGGTGTGLLFWSALGLLAGLPYWQAAAAGVAFVAGGLFMVWLEIGKPWRALNVYTRPGTSWMTREGILALPLLAAGLFAALSGSGMLSGVSPSLVRAMAVLAAVLGCAFLYCQLRILDSARSLPAWRGPRAMLLIGLSGLTEGFGLYLVVLALLGSPAAGLSGAMLFVLAGRAWAWRWYMASLPRTRAPRPTLLALRKARHGFLLIGHLVPAAFLLSAWVVPTAALPLTAAAGVAATSAGWLLKIVLVTRAAWVPANTVPMPPVRGRSHQDTSAHGLRKSI